MHLMSSMDSMNFMQSMNYNEIELNLMDLMDSMHLMNPMYSIKLMNSMNFDELGVFRGFNAFNEFEKLNGV